MVFSDLREFVAILCANINSREQSEDITDSHIMVCLLSSILPLTKCPIPQAVEHLQCQHPRGKRLSEVIKDEME